MTGIVFVIIMTMPVSHRVSDGNSQGSTSSIKINDEVEAQHSSNKENTGEGQLRISGEEGDHAHRQKPANGVVSGAFRADQKHGRNGQHHSGTDPKKQDTQQIHEANT